MGLVCAMPFFAANAVVANRVEPFFSWIRPGPHTSAFEYVLLPVTLGLIAVGVVIAVRPLFERGARPGARTYILNGGVGVLMLAAFLILSFALGSEIYRCDVLGTPNCD